MDELTNRLDEVKAKPVASKVARRILRDEASRKPSIRARIRNARSLEELQHLVKQVQQLPGVSTQTLKKILKSAEVTAKRLALPVQNVTKDVDAT